MSGLIYSGDVVHLDMITGYSIASFGFMLATGMFGIAVSRFGKSIFGSLLYYILIGTGIFFFISVFQILGAEFFGVGVESMTLWWHAMFYLAFVFYYRGFKQLSNLGIGSLSHEAIKVGVEKIWCVIAIVLLVAIFFIPRSVDSVAIAYQSLTAGKLGLHHVLAFLLSMAVGSYVLGAKEKLGQIGRIIANPMIATMWLFALLNFWQMLYFSWKVIPAANIIGEGVAQALFISASASICYAAWKLDALARTA